MEINEAQDNIKKFDNARVWECNWNLKDLMLNIGEEVEELRTLVKWIDEEKQKKVIAERINEISDFIGNSLFLILKIANQTEIDARQALENILKEYEKRMSSEIMKKGHANKLAGGIDHK